MVWLCCSDIPPALTLVLTLNPRATAWLCCICTPPALTPVFTFSPCAVVWLCCILIPPALTLVLTFKPRAIVWLCCAVKPPALTFDLIFIPVFSFLEKLIEVDCGENHCPLSQVAESRWILLANIFSAHGVPIGEESACRSPR